jgi:cysteine desulfurase
VVKIEGAELVGSLQLRLANTVSFIVRGTDSIALLAGLDVEGVCASSGSACSAGSLEASHVVSALGLRPDLAKALVRFSLGRESSQEEVEFVVKVLPEIVQRAQRAENRANTL